MAKPPPRDVTANSEPRYWFAPFTDATWRTLRQHGARTAGFRESRWLSVKQIRRGDYLLCYLTGASRLIGALSVTGDAYFDPTPLWPEDRLPSRLPVKAAIMLSAETAVPITELRDRLSLFSNLKHPNAWTARLRRSAIEWPREDGEAVLEALIDAELYPVVRELNPRRLRRQPRGFRRAETTAVAEPPINLSGFQQPASHTEIQWLLLKLGADLGLDLWVARNDRGRGYAGRAFADLPRLLARLPRQFDPATMRTVEHIDVLWLSANAIVAAFEVESTTTIYSGLLRMADLLAVQPNLNIPLYLVAPDARREKVIAEVNRPAFNRHSPALRHACRYIAFSTLRLKTAQGEGLGRHLKPSFIDEFAEPCDAPPEQD